MGVSGGADFAVCLSGVCGGRASESLRCVTGRGGAQLAVSPRLEAAAITRGAPADLKRKASQKQPQPCQPRKRGSTKDVSAIEYPHPPQRLRDRALTRSTLEMVPPILVELKSIQDPRRACLCRQARGDGAQQECLCYRERWRRKVAATQAKPGGKEGAAVPACRRQGYAPTDTNVDIESATDGHDEWCSYGRGDTGTVIVAGVAVLAAPAVARGVLLTALLPRAGAFGVGAAAAEADGLEGEEDLALA